MTDRQKIINEYHRYRRINPKSALYFLHGAAKAMGTTLDDLLEESQAHQGLVPSIPVTGPPPPSPYPIRKQIEDAYVRYDSDPRVNGPDDFEAFRDALEALA